MGSSGNEKGEALGAQERLPRGGTDSTSQVTRRAGPGRERTEGRERQTQGLADLGTSALGQEGGDGDCNTEKWRLEGAKFQGTSS